MKPFYIAVFLSLFLVPNVVAQDFSDLDPSPLDIASFPSSYRISDKSIKVVYSRPQLNGRELSSLAPAGKVWRTGANEATEITLYKDYVLGETTVPEGTYTLYTIPGEENWTVIINSATNVWGAFGYNQDLDVARITVPVKKPKSSVYVLGETTVPEGTYTLYTIPGEENWTVIINSATNVWGASGYNQDLDVARITVPVKKPKSSVEVFSMAFEKVQNGAHLHIAWGHVHIVVPFIKA